MTNIVIIQGHPSPDANRLCRGSAAAYGEGDGSDAGEDRVRLAMQIARVTGAQPVLFVVAPTDGEAKRIITHGEKMAPPGSDIIVHRFFPGTPAPVADALIGLAPSFALLDIAGDPFGDNQLTRTLLQAGTTSIVLLRGRDRPE